MQDEILKTTQKKLNELVDKRHELQDDLNKWGKDKIFFAVKDVYKTPYSVSGTNFKGRKCKLSFSTLNDVLLCYPTFQNLRTGVFDMKTDYSYSVDHFEYVSE